MDASKYSALIAAARNPHDLTTLAFAGVMAMAPARRPPYNVPISGVDRSAMHRLLSCYFPHIDPTHWLEATPQTELSDRSRLDEFHDLLDLFAEHANPASDECRWVGFAVATASMGENHLWQDMGLPDRRSLSRLIEENFSSLFARNVGDMKWKKFFYRQLCEKAEVLICKSPSCDICVDYHECFGSEEQPEPGYFKIETHVTDN